MDDLLKFAAFDFAVIRYEWTAEGGTDLDTRTKVIQPLIAGEVGWSRLSNVGDYLLWGGDNTETGQESILIDFKKLAEDYPEQTPLEVQLAAFWYAVRNSGDFNLTFETYKGGTMEQVGFAFENVGGELVQTQTVGRNVATNISADVDGEIVGSITYNPATLQATFA
ncbi:hypothetical protein [Coraliomargarita parva]|uniref:hypothetical protein n=1 Tax=Coraliomargarita parva TaxID=3014050 RepID=UPI0022B2ED30|nr:hypothetical protein [Coraliomargarita parva]